MINSTNFEAGDAKPPPYFRFGAPIQRGCDGTHIDEQGMAKTAERKYWKLPAVWWSWLQNTNCDMKIL